MLESEKFDGINVSTDVKTWLARGVGPGQSEIVNIDSEIVNIDGSTQKHDQQEELTAFVKG